MSYSRREQIIQALKVLWSASGGPTGLTVHRNPARPFQNEKFPAVALSVPTDPGGSAAETVEVMDHGTAVERVLRVRGEVRCKGVDADTVHIQVDTINNWLLTQIATDRTLGGLCERITEIGSAPGYDEGDEFYAAWGTEFEVRFFTSEDDPTQAAGAS